MKLKSVLLVSEIKVSQSNKYEVKAKNFIILISVYGD